MKDFISILLFVFGLLLVVGSLAFFLTTDKTQSQNEKQHHPTRKDSAPSEEKERGSIFHTSEVEERLRKILQKMTLDDKINQTFLLSYPLDAATNPASLAYALANNIGGFDVSAPGADLSTASAATRKAQIESIISQVKASGAYKIPAFFAVDNLHGAAFGQENVSFPQNSAYHNMSIEDISRLAEAEGEATARGSLESGINMIFGPSAIEAYNKCFGSVYESAGTNGDRVFHFVKHFVKGAQRIQNGRIHGVVTNCKHFVADGSTILTNTIYGNFIEFGVATSSSQGQGDLETLLKNSTAGFTGGIEEQTGGVMTAFCGITSLPLPNSQTSAASNLVLPSSNRDFIEILRNPPRPDSAKNTSINFRTGFGHKGFVLSDFDGANTGLQFQGLNVEDPTIYYSAIAHQLAVGHDFLLLGDLVNASSLASSVGNPFSMTDLRIYIKNHISEERIHEAAGNILRVKIVAGLFDVVERLGKEDKIRDAKNAYELAVKSFIYTSNYYGVNGSGVIPGINNSFPTPDGPILSSKAATILLLGREADPMPDTFGNKWWNAFYDDLGIQSGGWSYVTSFNGCSGNRLFTDGQSTFPNPSAASPNINDMFVQSRAKVIDTKSNLHQASTILDGFRNAGVNAIPIPSVLTPYTAANAVAVAVLGEFPYQETNGEITNPAVTSVTFVGGGGSGASADAVIDPTTGAITGLTNLVGGYAFTSAPSIVFTSGGVGLGTGASAIGVINASGSVTGYTSLVGGANYSSNSIFDVSLLEPFLDVGGASGFNALEGVKISGPTYANLKAAYNAGIPIVVIIISGRGSLDWNTAAPMNPLLDPTFGSMSISQISTNVVFAGLPGTTGGDAIVNFLYNTPWKQGKGPIQWQFVPQNVIPL